LLDGSGHTVTIKARPQRIVSQTLATDEILLAVCEPERIIAFSKFALDPEYSNVADIVRQQNVRQVESTEDIVTLNPDLIFIASYSRAEIAEQLKTVGAPVFRFASFASIDDIKKNIRSVGYATGDDERAAAIVAEMERRLENSRARIPHGGKPPRVLSYGLSGSTAGSDTLFDDILRTVGAINVAAERGLKGFQRISAEQITEWQPDFIITGSAPNTLEDTRRRLLANPAVAASNAARAGHIIIMDNQLFLAVSHHITDTMDALIDELYGKPAANIR
jgi:iron complex transport system substrate-binding protein